MPRCTKLFVSQIPKALQFNDKFCPLNEVQTLLCWLNAHHCCLPFASHCAQFPPLPMNGINLRVFFWLEIIMVSCRNTRFFRQNTDKTQTKHRGFTIFRGARSPIHWMKPGARTPGFDAKPWSCCSSTAGSWAPGGSIQNSWGKNAYIVIANVD